MEGQQGQGTYMLSNRGRLRGMVIDGGERGAAIEEGFAGGREKFAYAKKAMADLLVGSELVAHFSDVELHRASRPSASKAELREKLEKAKAAMAPGTQAACRALLRLVERWLLAVMPERFVAMTGDKPAGGWQVRAAEAGRGRGDAAGPSWRARVSTCGPGVDWCACAGRCCRCRRSDPPGPGVDWCACACWCCRRDCPRRRWRCTSSRSGAAWWSRAATW